MKKKVCAIALTLLCFGVAIAQEKKPGEVLTEYDRFKDLTTIRIRPMPLIEPLTEGLSFSTVIAYKGQSPIKKDYADLQFISTSATDWQYLSDRDLIFLIDGERLVVGEIPRDIATISNGLALESMTTSISYQMLLRIANAKKVEGKLGRKEFELKPEQQKSLLNFAGKMRP